MNIYIWDKERDQLRVLTTHNHILHNSDYLQLEVFNIFFILLNIMNIKITRTEKIWQIWSNTRYGHLLIPSENIESESLKFLLESLHF